MAENHDENLGEQPKEQTPQHDKLYHWVYVFGPSIALTAIDLGFYWREYPEYHLLELLIAAALMAAPTAYELHRNGWTRIPTIAIVAMIFAAAVACYFAFGVYEPPEAPTEGSLYPLDMASAETACSDSPDFPGGMFANFEDPRRQLVVALGRTGVIIPFFDKAKTAEDQALNDNLNSGSRTLLRAGTCDVLKIRRSEGGLAVDADVVYPSGAVAAKIRGNNFHLFPPEFLHSETPDRGTLFLRNRDGKELFWIRYLNPNSVEIRGFFSCKGGPLVHITERRITTNADPGLSNRGVCAMLEFPSEPGQAGIVARR
jgi:hypothetical protein